MPENQRDADSASVHQLPRPVWILSWVSFFADVSSEMVYPLLPLFMIGVLMGLFYGLTGLTTLIASLSAGILWDRFGAPAALLLVSGFAVLAIIALMLIGKRALPLSQPR